MEDISKAEFEWDPKKDATNIAKHGVSFFEAQQAFLDQNRIIAQDLEHSKDEIRYYCFGKVQGLVMTVRFTYRNRTIRIIGAGYRREGRKIYEKTQR